MNNDELRTLLRGPAFFPTNWKTLPIKDGGLKEVSKGFVAAPRTYPKDEAMQNFVSVPAPKGTVLVKPGPFVAVVLNKARVGLDFDTIKAFASQYQARAYATDRLNAMALEGPEWSGQNEAEWRAGLAAFTALLTEGELDEEQRKIVISYKGGSSVLKPLPPTTRSDNKSKLTAAAKSFAEATMAQTAKLFGVDPKSYVKSKKWTAKDSPFAVGRAGGAPDRRARSRQRSVQSPSRRGRSPADRGAARIIQRESTSFGVESWAHRLVDTFEGNNLDDLLDFQKFFIEEAAGRLRAANYLRSRRQPAENSSLITGIIDDLAARGIDGMSLYPNDPLDMAEARVVGKYGPQFSYLARAVGVDFAEDKKIDKLYGQFTKARAEIKLDYIRYVTGRLLEGVISLPFSGSVRQVESISEGRHSEWVGRQNTDARDATREDRIRRKAQEWQINMAKMNDYIARKNIKSETSLVNNSALAVFDVIVAGLAFDIASFVPGAGEPRQLWSKETMAFAISALATRAQFALRSGQDPNRVITHFVVVTGAAVGTMIAATGDTVMRMSIVESIAAWAAYKVGIGAVTLLFKTIFKYTSVNVLAFLGPFLIAGASSYVAPILTPPLVATYGALLLYLTASDRPLARRIATDTFYFASLTFATIIFSTAGSREFGPFFPTLTMVLAILSLPSESRSLTLVPETVAFGTMIVFSDMIAFIKTAS